MVCCLVWPDLYDGTRFVDVLKLRNVYTGRFSFVESFDLGQTRVNIFFLEKPLDTML